MSRLDRYLATVPARLRRPLARTLQVVAVTGALVSLLVGGLGWHVVGQVDDIVVESAALTADALDALGDSLLLAADLVESVDTTLVAVEDALEATTSSVADGGDALDSVARLADDAAPALESSTRTLRTLEGVGDNIDSALRGLSALPLAPDYDPAQGLGVTAGELADDLEPLADSFATTADDLDDVADSTDQLEGDLRSLQAAVGAATEQLAASEELIADYRATADRAGAVTEDAGGGLGGELALLRVLLLIGGVVLALGHAVPWVLGGALLTDAAPDAPDAAAA